MTFDVKTFNVPLYDEILSKGLSKGLGERDSNMCIEAAICTVLGLEHGDDPGCVARSVRSFKITLNDKHWTSKEARAKGLHDLGLAQLGSLGVVNDVEFMTRLSKKTIQVLIPTLFREIYPNNEKLLNLALVCEKEGSRESIINLKTAADADAAAAVAAAYAAAYAAAAADAAAAAYAAAYAAAAAAAAAADAAAAAYAAAYAAAAAAAADAAAAAYAAAAAKSRTDKYLILIADLALEVLRELNSPGIALLEK